MIPKRKTKQADASEQLMELPGGIGFRPCLANHSSLRLWAPFGLGSTEAEQRRSPLELVASSLMVLPATLNVTKPCAAHTRLGPRHSFLHHKLYEFVVIDASVTILVSFSYHLVHFVIGKLFAN